MSTPNTVEIGKHFYILRSEEEDFHRNIFVKSCKKGEASPVHIIFDPGTKLDLANLNPFLTKLIGGLDQINIVFLSHQDPDLTSNTSLVMTAAPKSVLITSVDTWRIVKMYGLPEKRVRTVESFNSNTISIRKTGQKIRFIPAPFCHFRGAMMAYDYESRVLFSGDFMAGVNTRKGDGVFADEESWEGIKLFHQLYMPSGRALKHAVNNIASLNPFPEVIAPQHGDIIKGDLVVEFLQRISELEVGMDLLTGNAEQKDTTLMAINNFLGYVQEEHNDVFNKLVNEFQKDNKFTSPFQFSNGSIIDIKVASATALYQIWSFINVLAEDNPNIDHLKAVFTDTLMQFDIESPFTKPQDSEDSNDLFNSLID